jgi:hypothetical protein
LPGKPDVRTGKETPAVGRERFERKRSRETQGASMRKFLCAAFVIVVGVSFVLAEEFNATITEIKDGKISITKKGPKKGDEAVKASFKVADNVVVKKAKVSKDGKKTIYEDGDAIADGLKNEIFGADKLKDGVTARLYTEGEGDAAKVVKILTTEKKVKGAN